MFSQCFEVKHSENMQMDANGSKWLMYPSPNGTMDTVNKQKQWALLLLLGNDMDTDAKYNHRMWVMLCQDHPPQTVSEVIMVLNKFQM